MATTSGPEPATLAAVIGSDARPSAAVVTMWEAAKRLAGDGLMGTEHVLKALLSAPSSATCWVAAWGLSVPALLARCDEVAAAASSTTSSGLSVSPRVVTALSTAKLLVDTAGGVEMGTESVVCALLLSAVDGAAAGRLLVQQAESAGVALKPADVIASLLPSVSASNFVAARDELVVKGREETMAWHTFVIRGPAEGKDGDSADATAEVVTVPVPPLAPVSAADTMAGPIRGTNWLVPGRVACGPRPGASGTSAGDVVAALLGAGIRTFVSLEAEFEPMEYQSRYYPRHIRSWVASHAGVVVRHNQFPIPDFFVADPYAMLALCQHLATLVRRGENIYIHCHGGHGRTGMVVISLLMALYDLPLEAARERALKFHQARPCPCSHVPETAGQMDALRRLQGVMRRESHR